MAIQWREVLDDARGVGSQEEVIVHVPSTELQPSRAYLLIATGVMGAFLPTQPPSAAYVQLCQVEAGAPTGGIGHQCHVDQSTTFYARQPVVQHSRGQPFFLCHTFTTGTAPVGLGVCGSSGTSASMLVSDVCIHVFDLVSMDATRTAQGDVPVPKTDTWINGPSFTTDDNGIWLIGFQATVLDVSTLPVEFRVTTGPSYGTAFIGSQGAGAHIGVVQIGDRAANRPTTGYMRGFNEVLGPGGTQFRVEAKLDNSAPYPAFIREWAIFAARLAVLDDAGIDHDGELQFLFGNGAAFVRGLTPQTFDFQPNVVNHGPRKYFLTSAAIIAAYPQDSFDWLSFVGANGNDLAGNENRLTQQPISLPAMVPSTLSGRAGMPIFRHSQAHSLGGPVDRLTQEGMKTPYKLGPPIGGDVQGYDCVLLAFSQSEDSLPAVPVLDAPGAKIGVVPGRESLDVASLPTLPIPPSFAHEYESEFPGVATRMDSGDVVSWPLMVTERRKFRLHWNGLTTAQKDSLVAFLERGEFPRRAFRSDVPDFDGGPDQALLHSPRSIRVDMLGPDAWVMSSLATELIYTGVAG